MGISVAAAIAEGDSLVAGSLDPFEVAAFAVFAVFIGINEELWFRGLLVAELGGAARPWLAVLGSGLLFGLPHVAGDAATTLNAIAVALAVGIPFAVVRVRGASLLPLVGWHAIIDAWAFVHTASVVAQGAPSLGEIAAGLVLPALIAAVYLAWLARPATRAT